MVQRTSSIATSKAFRSRVLVDSGRMVVGPLQADRLPPGLEEIGQKLERQAKIAKIHIDHKSGRTAEEVRNSRAIPTLMGVQGRPSRRD